MLNKRRKKNYARVKACNGCHKVPGDKASGYCSKCYRWAVTYGIKPETVHKQLQKQEGRCAICGIYPTKNRALAIDHDHISYRFRGLLCSKCNIGLGYFTLETIETAFNYLKSPPADMDFVSMPGISKKIKQRENEELLLALRDPTTKSLRAKATIVAPILNISFEAALSRLRRVSKKVGQLSLTHGNSVNKVDTAVTPTEQGTFANLAPLCHDLEKG